MSATNPIRGEDDVDVELGSQRISTFSMGSAGSTSTPSLKSGRTLMEEIERQKGALQSAQYTSREKAYNWLNSISFQVFIVLCVFVDVGILFRWVGEEKGESWKILHGWS